MPMVPLRNIGAGGLAPDQEPYDVELTQFAAGNNVQLHAGRIGKSYGYVAAQSLAFQPTHVQGWSVESDDSVLIGSANGLFRLRVGAVTDVTSLSYVGGYSNSPRWQSSQIGTGMLANNGADRPQYMAANGTRFGDLANWPSTLRTGNLKPFLSFLVMAGYTEGAAEYPYTVRWSDEFDPTSVPGSYDITSTTNLAGENVLGGRFGKLVDALPLGGNNIIYAESGSYVMQFIGAPLVFAFRELFDDDGIINPGAVSVFENRHFVVGRNDIYVHDGSSKQSITNKRIKDTFYSELGDPRSVFVNSDPETSEIWVCFADKNATDTRTANRAWVWNWSNNAWTSRDVPNIRAMANGPDVSSTASATWDGLDVPWDNWSQLWSDIGAAANARTMRLYSAGYLSSKLFAHNESFAADGTGFTAYLESSKIDLDAVLQRPTERMLQILRIVPQISGVGQVTFKIGSSNSPQGPVLWKNTKVFNIETDYKVDTRATGRYLAIRVESTAANGQWQLSGFDLDVEEVAGR